MWAQKSVVMICVLRHSCCTRSQSSQLLPRVFTCPSFPSLPDWLVFKDTAFFSCSLFIFGFRLEWLTSSDLNPNHIKTFDLWKCGLCSFLLGSPVKLGFGLQVQAQMIYLHKELLMGGWEESRGDKDCMHWSRRPDSSTALRLVSASGGVLSVTCSHVLTGVHSPLSIPGMFCLQFDSIQPLPLNCSPNVRSKTAHVILYLSWSTRDWTIASWTQVETFK